MTTVYDSPPDIGDAETVAQALRAAHATWLQETDSFLTPITVPNASFWERWTAVRYLNDQFGAQYHRECALVNELRPFLPPKIAEGLVRSGERVGELLAELDQIGRRRRTAPSIAAVADRLGSALRSWCAEIEAAASAVSREILPKEALQLLADFQLYAETHA